MSRYNSRKLAAIEAKIDRIIQYHDVPPCEDHTWRTSSVGPNRLPVQETCIGCGETREIEREV